MAKKFFKKYFPTPDSIKENKALKSFGTLLHDPNLWHLNRHSVAGAFAIGLFVAFMPIPFQMIPAALLAIYFRTNLVISVSLVWITNPLTITPLFLAAYLLGTKILGASVQSFQFELSMDWIFMSLGSHWKPFLLGCFIFSICGSIVGYFGVRIFWRLHLVQRIKQKRLLYLQKFSRKSKDP